MRISAATRRAIEDKLTAKNYEKWQAKLRGVVSKWNKILNNGRLFITITVTNKSIIICERCQPLKEGWCKNEFTFEEFLKIDIL